MKIQDQKILHDPERGPFGFGSCYITTYASYLDLPVEECPQLQVLYGCNHPGNFFEQVMALWLKSFGLKEVFWPAPEAAEQLAQRDDYYFAIGPSPRGNNTYHQVIYKNGKLFHDPHPSRDGILSETEFITLEKIEQ